MCVVGGGGGGRGCVYACVSECVSERARMYVCAHARACECVCNSGFAVWLFL